MNAEDSSLSQELFNPNICQAETEKPRCSAILLIFFRKHSLPDNMLMLMVCTVHWKGSHVRAFQIIGNSNCLMLPLPAPKHTWFVLYSSWVEAHDAFEPSAHIKEGKNVAISMLSGLQSTQSCVPWMAFSVPSFARHHRASQWNLLQQISPWEESRRTRWCKLAAR